MIVLLGEVGGVEEYDVCKALKEKKLTKPLVAWCIGTCAGLFLLFYNGGGHIWYIFNGFANSCYLNIFFFFLNNLYLYNQLKSNVISTKYRNSI
jgi:hypothetical protein